MLPEKCGNIDSDLSIAFSFIHQQIHKNVYYEFGYAALYPKLDIEQKWSANQNLYYEFGHTLLFILTQTINKNVPNKNLQL